MKPSRCVLMLLAAGLLAAPTSPLAAQTLTAGPEIQVTLAGFLKIGETVPAIAADPGGGFLSVWRESGSLNARGFSPADAPLAGVRRLALPASKPSDAQIASLGNGRFVAIWTQGSLFAQFLDASGTPLGPRLVLADGVTPYGQAVAAEPSGGFVVSWLEIESSVYLGTRVLARRFDAQGAPVGDPVVVSPAGLVTSVAALPGGGMAVAWYRPVIGEAGAWGDILVRAFGPDGAPAGPETILSAAADHPYATVRVAADSTGRLVAAWTEFPTPDYSSRVRFRQLSPAGQPLGPAVEADKKGGMVASLGDVAVRSDGSFLLVWGLTSAVTGGPANVPADTLPGGGDVLARAYSSAGEPLGPSFLVHETAAGEQHEGEAEATSDGWIVAWRRRLDPQAGVYARRFALSCGGTGAALCLNGHRFRAEVAWRLPTGQSGAGNPIPRTDDTGAFWFFAPANYELLVKVLDGRGTNGKFWVFYGSLTDVEFDLTITDTVTGQQRVYHNPAGTLASRADTEAF